MFVLRTVNVGLQGTIVNLFLIRLNLPRRDYYNSSKKLINFRRRKAKNINYYRSRDS